MPKKFKGENSKAVEARARKNAQKEEEKLQKDRAAEDEYWRDDDKQVHRKQQRKEDKDRKRLEQLERKKELQKLHDEEMEQMKTSKKAVVPGSSKMSRADISANLERQRQEEEEARRKNEKVMHHEVVLEENINRVVAEGDEARTVEEAISVLSVKEPTVDKHPEKRMKAAYQAFEDEHLPRLKQENSNMRLSQLKQMLRKDWMKSPENPLNQRILGYK